MWTILQRAQDSIHVKVTSQLRSREAGIPAWVSICPRALSGASLIWKKDLAFLTPIRQKYESNIGNPMHISEPSLRNRP